MKKTCEATGTAFEISTEDVAFYDNASPRIDGVKMPIPSPRLSPLARARRRLAFLNQIYVYSRKSSGTGKPIFSMFPEEVPFPVFENEFWWSDSWNALAYGRPFDFSRRFFEQFDELSAVVPRFARMVLNVENCDYCTNVSACKNCFLVFNTRHAEDCVNCENVWGSRDCLECSHSASCELCFDCVTCERCYNVQSSCECEDCVDSFYLLNCRGCQNCFGCVNLRRREYCIFNEQYSKEQYREYLAGLDLATFSGRQKAEHAVRKFWEQHPRPHVVSSMAENVSGNYILQSKDVRDSMLVRNGESLRYCQNLFENVKSSYDFTAYGHNAELMYESVRCGNDVFNLSFSYYCFNGCSRLTYCAFCVGCEDCFGCIGLNKKRFCIFNVQYEEAEYKKLFKQITAHMQQTGEWGEFFPVKSSPFPYNHSLAQRYFPMTAEEIEAGQLWHYEKYFAENDQAISANALPDGLPAEDAPIFSRSALSASSFRISREEIRRLRALHAPLPRTTYDERMTDRADKMGGLALYARTCAKSGKKISTAIAPDSPWIVWERGEYEREFSA